MIVQADADDLASISVCKEALETLNASYPGYPWLAACKGGVLFVRNAMLLGLNRRSDGTFSITQQAGFNMRMSALSDAGVRKKKVIQAGGELLERANIARKAIQEGQGMSIMEGAV